MVFFFFLYLLPFQKYSSFLYYANWVMMTSQGVIVKAKTENQQYLWKEWGNEMDTWHVHVYLTTKIHQMVHNLMLLW